MKLKTIKASDIKKNARVLIRADFNVPMDGTIIVEDSKIRASLDTIRMVQKKQARVILMSHLGRPEGKETPELSLAPIAAQISKLLVTNVPLITLDDFDNARKLVENLHAGDIAMLENTRFYPDEEDADGVFARELSTLGDLFILDGFGVCHRPDASVVGVAKYLPTYAGLLLTREVDALEKMRTGQDHPFVIALAGAKTETKIPLIKSFVDADQILIGGVIYNTYLKALGYGIGLSKADDEYMDVAREYCSKKNIVLPVDVIVGSKEGKNAHAVSIPSNATELCGKDEGIFDIGPKTITLFSKYIESAKTLLWNGAMGFIEQDVYAKGSRAIAETLGKQLDRGVFSVAGGGETVEIIEQLHLSKQFTHVSTGGGAMLAFLAGENMPGVDCVKK